jgi:predicted phage terminase large subunit-like protein
MIINWKPLNKFATRYYSLDQNGREELVSSLFNQCQTIDDKKLLQEELKLLPYAFDAFARDKQRFIDYFKQGFKTVAFLGGRGAGKTFASNLFIRNVIYDDIVSKSHDILIVGPNYKECKKIMYDGDSGLKRLFPPAHEPKYNSIAQSITFHNGNRAYLRTSENADNCRGSNTALLVFDEIAAFEPNQLDMLYNNALASLRKEPAWCCISSTPKSDSRYGLFFKSLYEQSLNPENKILIIRGSSYENKDNLVDLEARYRQFDGTNFLKEEYEAELLFNDIKVPFPIENLNKSCISKIESKIKFIIIAIDPATTTNKNSDETGIVITALTTDNQFIVIDDLSGKHQPDTMSSIVIDQWYKYKIINKIETLVKYEANQGADFIGHAILSKAKSKNLDINQLKITSQHSSNSKLDRAYPVSVLLHDNKIRFIAQNTAGLREQLSNFTGFSSKHASDDRVDSFCMGINSLATLSIAINNRDSSNLPYIR